MRSISLLAFVSLLTSVAFCQPDAAPNNSKSQKELELELRSLRGSSKGLSKEEIRRRKRRMREIYRMGGFSHKPSTGAVKRQRRFSEIQANPEELNAWLKEQDKRNVRNLGHGFSGERVSLELMGAFDSEEALLGFYEENVGTPAPKLKADLRVGDSRGKNNSMDARRRSRTKIDQTLQTPSEIEISNLVPKFRKAFDRVGRKFGPEWADPVAGGKLRRSKSSRLSQDHRIENEFYLLRFSSTSRSFPFYERVRIFDPNGRELATIEDESRLKIAPGGKYYVAFDYSAEAPDGGLRLYSRTGRLVKEYKFNDETGAVIFSDDARFFARYSFNSRRLRFFRDNGELLYELPPDGSDSSGIPLAISKDGSLLTQGGDWFDLTGKKRWSTSAYFSGRPERMLLRPDRKLALTVEGYKATGGRPVMIVAVDLNSGRIVEKIPYRKISADQCNFIGDSHLLVSGPSLVGPDDTISTRFFLYKIELK